MDSDKIEDSMPGKDEIPPFDTKVQRSGSLTSSAINKHPYQFVPLCSAEVKLPSLAIEITRSCTIAHLTGFDPAKPIILHNFKHIAADQFHIFSSATISVVSMPLLTTRPSETQSRTRLSRDMGWSLGNRLEYKSSL